LDSDIKGGTQAEGVWEQGAEEDIWTDGRVTGSDGKWREGGGNCITRSFVICTQVEEDEMGGECSTNGGEEERL
jgi:hypothetical protein